MRGHDKTERGRGLGPFTNRQLTTIVCVAVVAMLMIPTAAIAAGASFTSKSNGTPGVKGVNTASNGVGVVGRGKHYGVFSNGPLGVATGKYLNCNGCVKSVALAAGSVDVNKLSAAATHIQPLASGQSESGHYATGGGSSTSGQLGVPFTYVQPLAAPIGTIINATLSPSPHCAGPGSADPGYLCIYQNQANGLAGFSTGDSDIYGAEAFWSVTTTASYVEGVYTVTAP